LRGGQAGDWRVTRKARVDYDYTPRSEYFDLNKRAPYEGWEQSRTKVEFLSVPEEDGQLPGSEPEWDDIDICAIGEVWNVVEDDRGTVQDRGR
jgi:hypothetical protein